MSEEIISCIIQSVSERINGVGSNWCSGEYVVMLVIGEKQGEMCLVRLYSFRSVFLFPKKLIQMCSLACKRSGLIGHSAVASESTSKKINYNAP